MMVMSKQTSKTTEEEKDVAGAAVTATATVCLFIPSTSY